MQKSREAAIERRIIIMRLIRNKMHVSSILFFMKTKIFFGDTAYSKDKFSMNNADEAINIRVPAICKTVDNIAHSWNIIAVVNTALCGLSAIQGIIIMNTSRYGKEGTTNI